MKMRPLVEPGPELNDPDRERFARHDPIPEIGVEGQRRLRAASVCVVGAGGLGSPALLYLAAAGIGRIGIIDSDAVELVNLQRQVLHTTAGIGTPKATSAAAAIASLDPGIDVVVHCMEQVDMIESVKVPGKIGVFLKCNTGMNRLGFRPEVYPEILSKLESLKSIGEIVLMTHFCCADGTAGVKAQMAVFEASTASMKYPQSLANSAALIRYPETRTEWVRPGIMLYGASPFIDENAASLGLKPAMMLSSKIIAVQQISPGEGIGYGPMFRADKPMRIGIVACGYADGYPRHAPNGTPVLVGGRLTGTLGRVSMDMLYVDVSQLPDAGIGTEVVLWGNGLPVEEVAIACGTISYELLCAIAPRVPVSYY